MADERLKILKMIQAGTIDAQEGARLLKALRTGNARNGADHRWLNICIMDHKTKQLIVKINIPMNLVTSAGFDALRFLAENTTWQQQKND